MTRKEEYSLLLKSPEWKEKRLIILRRDNFKCTKCRCKNNLQVHHKRYIKNKMPWEVPNSYLTTLCRLCHLKEHENRSISSFTKKNKKKNPSIRKVQRTLNKMYASLSVRDKELQKRYDDINKKSLTTKTGI
jgi:5-methylcytosine-specific restriction endonuclease McrA